ncbi:hypothetical protein Tco_1222865 [Tanacetum coccineum]
MQQPMPNPEYITDLTTAMNMALVLMAKAFKLNYSTPTNNNPEFSQAPLNSRLHAEYKFRSRHTDAMVGDEIFPIVNQVDARVQNFKIQFLKEASNFVRDFKSLAKEADESLAKHKALEFEIERLLKAVVSHDIMSMVQCDSIVDTSYIQTELDRTKEKLENCINKKEKEYAVLWNNC